MNVEIAIATRPMMGESANGDSVVTVRGDSIVIAVADGLGHGPIAAEASALFCGFVRENPALDLERLMRDGSEHISRTRGAAAAVVRISPEAETLSFVGVGNIELQAVSRDHIRPVCMPGIVGRPIRKVIEFGYRFGPGDLLAVFSDGISSRFDLKDYRDLLAQECADTILERHGKHHDDATCVIARYAP
jgi:serine/threonine protein phosphatase PrpC